MIKKFFTELKDILNRSIKALEIIIPGYVFTIGMFLIFEKDTLVELIFGIIMVVISGTISVLMLTHKEIEKKRVKEDIKNLKLEIEIKNREICVLNNELKNDWEDINPK